MGYVTGATTVENAIGWDSNCQQTASNSNKQNVINARGKMVQISPLPVKLQIKELIKAVIVEIRLKYPKLLVTHVDKKLFLLIL